MSPLDIRALQELFRLVDERMHVVVEYMRDGKCKDFPEYREYVGIVRGLTEALQFAEQLSADSRTPDQSVGVFGNIRREEPYGGFQRR